MAAIPPWLNVQPSDFVGAAIAGSKLATSQRENAARIGAGLAEAEMSHRAATQQANAAREMQRWELGERLRMAHEQIQAHNDRAANILDQRRLYQGGVLDIREEANKIAQQRADQAATRTGTAGASALRMTDLDKHLLSDALIRKRQAQTQAASALEHLSSGGVVPPEITERLNQANADIDSLSQRYMQPFQAPQLQEGARVRNKQTGQVGTVINGEIVPDDEDEDTPTAEENPYADEGLPVSGGFMYTGPNYDRPAL